VTSDGLVVLASEVGVLDLEPATVIRKGRLQPGRVFLDDTAAGRIGKVLPRVIGDANHNPPYADL
jgi:hypothetical protein